MTGTLKCPLVFDTEKPPLLPEKWQRAHDFRADQRSHKRLLSSGVFYAEVTASVRSRVHRVIHGPNLLTDIVLTCRTDELHESSIPFAEQSAPYWNVDWTQLGKIAIHCTIIGMGLLLLQRQ